MKEEDLELDSVVHLAATTFLPKHNGQARIRTGQPGAEYLAELLASDSPRRIYEVLRMKKETFLELCNWLETNTRLQSTIQANVQEQVAMFLMTMNKGASNRDVQERFQRSGDTVSRYFHQVFRAFMVLYRHYIRLPTLDTPISQRIAADPKYAPYFSGCVGALDGTHVAVYAPEEKQMAFRNRKGDLSMNVLAACDFDMNFTYLLGGWEGAAHDVTVLKEAVTSKGFETPPGRYWLADAGYSNSNITLVPYRGTRYHLKEQRLAGKAQGGCKPQNPRELFNLRHASLRNVVERIFGVLKRKYQIMLLPSEFSYDIQTRIPLACAALHMWVRMKEGRNADINLPSVEELSRGQSSDNPGDAQAPPPPLPEEPLSHAMNRFRDALAEGMWRDYQIYLRRGGSEVVEVEDV